MADAGTVLHSPALRRRASYSALGCLPSAAHDGVNFSLGPVCEEEEGPRHFLGACFLCRRPLPAASDVFMYRGDTAFCSEECREEQIELDEARGREITYRRGRHPDRRVGSGKQAPASAQHSLCARGCFRRHRRQLTDD